MRAITPAALRTELAERIAALPVTGRRTVLVDAAPGSEPELFAEELVDPLRALGFPVQRIDTRDFLRAASLRLERGHTDPDAYYEEWLDLGGLRREVFDRWRRTGPCSVLPALRNPDTDRPSRADYQRQSEGAVLLLAGSLLLGTDLPLDLRVHLATSERTELRRLDQRWQWMLPAIRRYRAEVAPEAAADVLVRFDHPERPAISD